MISDQGPEATAGRLVERARAKVNLTLRILGRRADGYHELNSLVAFADEADVLTLDVTRAPGVAVTGPFASALAHGDGHGDENLVTRALALAAAAAPGLTSGHITLEKHLPVAAGIGGGSADAAATLRLLRRANPHVAVDWMALAARLGADVPVCFANAAARMTGIGEALTPLGRVIELPIVLVNPMAAVPANKTAAVFKALAAGPLTAHTRRTALEPRDLMEAIASASNDLEAPATGVMPVIADVLAALRGLPEAQVVRLSGAGPTCFALFDTPVAATAGATLLSASHGAWWIRASCLT